MEKHIALLRGDGIGPEIVDSAVRVLEKIGEKYGHSFQFTRYLIGGAAIDETGVPLPQETIDGCLASDSVLLGAVGGPKWDGVEKSNRPERALLKLRNALGLYANLRPAQMFPQLAAASPLRADIAGRGIDFVVVRELIGGIYFGEHRTDSVDGEPVATDVMRYAEHEIERIARSAFETARRPCARCTRLSIC